jgi:hypothetical protein
MPRTSRVSVKASIIYLALGATLGAILLINRWIPLGSGVHALRASHVQFLVVGWLTQLIIGVGWWLFPPLPIGLRGNTGRPLRWGQAQRGSEPLFWAALACLNLGVLLQALFEPIHIWTQIDLFNVLSGLSGLLLLIAAVLFVVNLWGRVRELGKG